MSKYIVSFKENNESKEIPIEGDITYVISKNNFFKNFSFTFNTTITNYKEIESNVLTSLFDAFDKEGITDIKITQYIGERNFIIFEKESLDIHNERLDLNLIENYNENPETVKNIQVAFVLG